MGTANLPSPGSPHRIPALDGVRGIAVLMVLCRQGVVFGGFVPRSILDDLFAMSAKAGWAGVDLFFVLSGFLITGILFDTKQNQHYFRTFYIRRALRIVPLYYAFLLLYFIAAPLVIPAWETPRLSWGGLAWAASYLSNYPTGAHGWGVLPHPVRHIWSLAIEEQFYLLWPLLIYRVSRRRLMTLCLVGSGLAWGFRAVLVGASLPTAACVWTPARLGSLAIGGFVALAARHPDDLRVVKRWAHSVVPGLLAVGLAFILWRKDLSYTDVFVQLAGFEALAILFAAVIILAVTAEPGTIVNTGASLPILRLFGRYSYAIYLFQQPLFLSLRGMGLSAKVLPPVAGYTWPGVLLFVMIATALLLSASLISWHLWEKHFLHLKERFAYA